MDQDYSVIFKDNFDDVVFKDNFNDVVFKDSFEEVSFGLTVITGIFDETFDLTFD